MAAFGQQEEEEPRVRQEDRTPYDESYDVSMPDGRPLSAHVVMAVLGGDLAAVRNLVDPLSSAHRDSLMDEDGWDHMTLLDLACAQGHLDVCRYLVQQGSDVEGRHAVTEMTCLHGACSQGHVEVARYLVEEAGADPLAKCRNDCTPVDVAVVAGKKEVFDWFYQKFHVEMARGDFGPRCQAFAPAIAAAEARAAAERGVDILIAERIAQIEGSE